MTLQKPRPWALVKADLAKARAKLNKAENAKVRKRSGGRCEVEITLAGPWRCTSRAAEIHHVKGGVGRRGIGESALAKYKLHCCTRCHRDITNRVLVPVDPRTDAAHIVYERRR